MSKAWAKGSTYRWRRLRAAVLAANMAENGGKCGLQIRGTCEGMADQVHHVLGRAISGDNPKHLMAVCGPCNRKVGQPKGAPSPTPRPTSRW